MLVIAVLLTVLSVASLIALHTINTNNRFGGRRLTYNYWYLFWPLLLWAQAIMYRIIRSRITGKLYAWLHITGIAIAFILIPVLNFVALTVIEYRFNARGSLYVLNQARFYSFWFFFIISQVFFIAVLVTAFTKKEIIETTEGHTSIFEGMIDEE